MSLSPDAKGAIIGGVATLLIVGVTVVAMRGSGPPPCTTGGTRPSDGVCPMGWVPGPPSGCCYPPSS